MRMEKKIVVKQITEENLYDILYEKYLKNYKEDFRLELSTNINACILIHLI